MEISEAKVKLVSDKADKLKAFCTVTIDNEFVIRDIKVIKGTRGCFVAMPSRKLMDRCPSCGGKNHLRATYCNECGGSLRPNRVPHDAEGRVKLHADLAHPINSLCREKLQRRIIEAYEREMEASHRPGYVPVSDEDVPVDDAASFEEPRPAVVNDPALRPRPVDAAPAPSPPPAPPRQAQADSFSSGIF